MYSKNLFSKTMLCLSLALLAVIITSGCGSKSKQSELPSNSTVSISSPSSMNVGTTSIVVATVKSGSAGIANQVVTFTVTPSTAGHFTPMIDTTDANGEAATVFTAATTGSANIGVSVGDGHLSTNAAMAIEYGQQQNGSGNVSITLTPSLLLANGVDSSTVVITVRDNSGRPAPDSTAVKIVAGEKFVDKDGNGYWSAGIDSLVFDANANGRWDALGNISSTAIVSGGNGQVRVRYMAGNDALTVYIKATVNDKGISGFAELPLQLSPNAKIASIYLSSDSINLSVKQTGGIESSVLRATGYDQFGNRVPEGLVINFIITDGTGGGEHLGNVGLGPFQSVTNSQGVGIATIHSGTKSGTLRIRAYADTVISAATQVMISAGPPYYIVVGAEKCNVPYFATVAGVNNIAAVVSDRYFNPVNDSTVVYFTTDEGTMKSHEERTRDHEGIAKTKWLSGDDRPAANGRVLIIAETEGGTVADTSMFFNTWFTDTIRVYGAPTSIPADGVSTVTVLVVGVDLNGNPVISGTAFEAAANWLRVSGSSFEDGCYSSSARVKIVSAILDMDHSRNFSNDDGIGAIDYVQYYNGTAAVSFPVQMLTGNSYSGKSSIIVPGSAVMGQTVDIGATIQDRWGNPLADHSLTVKQSGITIGSLHTDSYGEAFGASFVPSDSGTYIITVFDNDPRGGIVISKSLSVTAQ